MQPPWHGHAQWRVLSTDFGDGQHFLTTWARWRADPQRPRQLHYCAVTPHPVRADSLCSDPLFYTLAAELAPHCRGLTPGFHRITLDDMHACVVLLTLCVGDLRTAVPELAFNADELVVTNLPPSWNLYTLKALARRCRRGTRLCMDSVDTKLHDGLRQCGFDLAQGIFNPAWEPKLRQAEPPPVDVSHCVVIGAGLAGAAVAASLARRGWRVTVLDAATAPAQGASSLPVGLLATHVSPDDGTLSRLSRAGTRITVQTAQAVLQEGVDWACSGVLEHRVDGSPGLAKRPTTAAQDWSTAANAAQLQAAGLPLGATAVWHASAGWIKPAALVNALLAHPNITWQGHSTVAALHQHNVSSATQWTACDAQGAVLAHAPLVVVATAYASQTLIPGLRLQAVRGQVTLGQHAACDGGAAAWPPFPVNGHGHLIPHFPEGNTTHWAVGATFERDATDITATAQEVAQRDAENSARLQVLLPGQNPLQAPSPAFIGIRCVSPDRLPIVGQVDAGLWVSTAMGSRGLSFALLCAELIAARLHGEPLPLEVRLAKSMGVQRIFARIEQPNPPAAQKA